MCIRDSFWRYIKEEQLSDLLERLVQLLLPSAIDQTGLQGVVHERIWRIAIEVRPMLVDYANPTSPAMAARGVKNEGFFGKMVELISTRKTVYGPSASGLLGRAIPSTRIRRGRGDGECAAAVSPGTPGHRRAARENI